MILGLTVIHFKKVLLGKPSYNETTFAYPVCIECLHVCDHAILRRCRTVAAFAGRKQDESIPGGLFSYRWDAAGSEEK